MTMPSNIHRLVKIFQIAAKAERSIVEVGLETLAYRAAFAGLGLGLLLFAYGMVNVAAFQALQSAVGTIWAALCIAGADFAIGAGLLWVSSRKVRNENVVLLEEVRDQTFSVLGAELQQFSPRLFLHNNLVGPLEAQAIKSLFIFLSRVAKVAGRKSEQ
jgi:hypothetical protein